MITRERREGKQQDDGRKALVEYNQERWSGKEREASLSYSNSEYLDGWVDMSIDWKGEPGPFRSTGCRAFPLQECNHSEKSY